MASLFRTSSGDRLCYFIQAEVERRPCIDVLGRAESRQALLLEKCASGGVLHSFLQPPPTDMPITPQALPMASMAALPVAAAPRRSPSKAKKKGKRGNNKKGRPKRR